MRKEDGSYWRRRGLLSAALQYERKADHWPIGYKKQLDASDCCPKVRTTSGRSLAAVHTNSHLASSYIVLIRAYSSTRGVYYYIPSSYTSSYYAYELRLVVCIIRERIIYYSITSVYILCMGILNINKLREDESTESTTQCHIIGRTDR